MTEQPLYATVDIELIREDIEVSMIGEEQPRVIGSIPKYRATITVEFDKWIPEKIERIAKSGVL